MSSNKNISPWESHTLNRNTTQRSQNNNNTDYSKRSSFKPTDTRPFNSSQYSFSSNLPTRGGREVSRRNTTQKHTQYNSHNNTRQSYTANPNNSGLWQGPGDVLPSYFGPTVYRDNNGEVTQRPTISQWTKVEVQRSLQVGLGAACIHFGESLVRAYLPWEDSNE